MGSHISPYWKITKFQPSLAYSFRREEKVSCWKPHHKQNIWTETFFISYSQLSNKCISTMEKNPPKYLEVNTFLRCYCQLFKSLSCYIEKIWFNIVEILFPKQPLRARALEIISVHKSKVSEGQSIFIKGKKSRYLYLIE